MVRGIDIFSGAGGLSLGACCAGISVQYAIESNIHAAATYNLNHADTDVICADIRSVEPRPFKRAGLTILFGGPPCQGFSTSNQKTRNAANPRNWLFSQFLRYTKATIPDWVVLENVKGLRETANGMFESLIRKELERMGYKVAIWVLNAVDYGVPQKRSRVFFIGTRNGRIPPEPKKQKRHFTVRDAISDLPDLSPGAMLDELVYKNGSCSSYAHQMRGGLKSCSGHVVTNNNSLVLRRYRHIPPGGNWCDIPARLMKNYTNLVDNRSRHTGIYRRLAWDEPSIVIANFRKNMLVHPDQHRGLSVREAARLQSFPDHYRFSGSIGLQQQQVSNAVPPLLAKAVFSQIIQHA